MNTLENVLLLTVVLLVICGGAWIIKHFDLFVR